MGIEGCFVNYVTLNRTKIENEKIWHNFFVSYHEMGESFSYGKSLKI